MLLYPDNRPFATGSVQYEYLPSDSKGGNHRIFCPVQIAGVTISAALDTGGVYFICDPETGRAISPEAQGSETILIRGRWIQGALERHDLTFVADQGQALTIDATLFIPNEDQDENWLQGAPSFFGLRGCLEYIRFAIDTNPSQERFYFGKYGDDEY